MLISDVFMGSPFVNSAFIGLFNGEIVKFNKKARLALQRDLKCILLASKPLTIM